MFILYSTIIYMALLEWATLIYTDYFEQGVIDYRTETATFSCTFLRVIPPTLNEIIAGAQNGPPVPVIQFVGIGRAHVNK